MIRYTPSIDYVCTYLDPIGSNEYYLCTMFLRDKREESKSFCFMTPTPQDPRGPTRSCLENIRHYPLRQQKKNNSIYSVVMYIHVQVPCYTNYRYFTAHGSLPMNERDFFWRSSNFFCPSRQAQAYFFQPRRLSTAFELIP